MLTISMSKNKKELYIKSHFNYKYRIKKLAGAIFDFERKCWKIPVSSLSNLLEEFDGELYFKTPLWQILGKNEPDKEETFYYCPENIILPKMKLKPFGYQEEGIRFLIDRVNHFNFALCADSVGFGKTLESLTTLKYFCDKGGVNKILIICKKSIKEQWKNEIRKFSDLEADYPIYITCDNARKKNKEYESFSRAEKGILITNYHNYLRDAEIVKNNAFDFIIIDEVHQLKGYTGKMHLAIADIVQGKRALLLTGTPVMSRPSDIYGIISLVDNTFFGDYKHFEENYLVVEKEGLYGYQIIGAKNLNELSGKIKNFMIRRCETDISLKLPEVIVKQYWFEPDRVQKNTINLLEAKMGTLLAEKQSYMSGGRVIKSKAAEFNSCLEKEKGFLPAKQFIADDPRCLAYKKNRLLKELYSTVPKNYKPSAKTEATLELAEDIINSGEKLIIFTHYLTPLLMLEDMLKKKWPKDVKIYSYSGRENDKTRNENIAHFVNDDDVSILLCTDAAAEGLNLQACHYIINYEQPDTYAIKNQRAGRIRRIGSEASYVRIYDMLTRKTLDETKMNKIERDKNLSASLLD